MPPSKPKPSEIAAEAKRYWLPHIRETYIKNPQTSFLYPQSTAIRVGADKRSHNRTRVAVLEGDPINHALGWYQTAIRDPAHKHCRRIPVVNMANEKRAGGDWESGLTAPEECFARRSNLVQALTMPWNAQMGRDESHYPIPEGGGIYCPEVFVFRGGPDMDYATFQDMVSLPVISVAPIRAPRLNGAGTDYSFEEEKGYMKEKMRTVLRIAAYCDHKSLVIGAFGLGPVFRNPAREVAKMWRQLLYEEEEFRGVFADVVFVLESSTMWPATTQNGASDVEIFREELDPSRIFPTQYA